ncbi:MAG: isoprenylcysteine carboxylmethyltransferase family protein [Terracidiphilus sp.]|jgi:protein-S-isoprenylcysteine O-methyltransferase Ste14
MIPQLLISACWIVLVVYWRIGAGSVKPAAERQDWRGRLMRLPVWLGYLSLVAAAAYPLGPLLIAHTDRAEALGVILCLLGLFTAIWSRKTLGAEWSQDVELKQGHKLVTRGPYRFVRHPIYTGHLLMALGTAIACGTIAGFAGCLFFLVGFWIKLSQEEKLLTRNFPEEYPAYKKHVKALAPFVF